MKKFILPVILMVVLLFSVANLLVLPTLAASASCEDGKCHCSCSGTACMCSASDGKCFCRCPDNATRCF